MHPGSDLKYCRGIYYFGLLIIIGIGYSEFIAALWILNFKFILKSRFVWWYTIKYRRIIIKLIIIYPKRNSKFVNLDWKWRWQLNIWVGSIKINCEHSFLSLFIDDITIYCPFVIIRRFIMNYVNQLVIIISICFIFESVF